MKTKALIILLATTTLSAASSQVSILPTSDEISYAFDVEMTNGMQSVKQVWSNAAPLLERIYSYNQEFQFRWVIEQHSITNIFLRCCAFNFPTNDLSAYSDFSRYMMKEILPSFKGIARKSNNFCDLALAQIPNRRYWEYPTRPQALIDAPMGATTGGPMRYRDPDLNALSTEHWCKCRRISALNNSVEEIRRTLIDLARPGVARRSAAMTDAEWTSFTNSVTTSAGLNKKEQTSLFGSLRGTSDAP